MLPSFLSNKLKSKKQTRLAKIFQASVDKINNDCDLLQIITQIAKFKEFIQDISCEFGDSRINKIMCSNKAQTIDITESEQSEEDDNDGEDYLFFLHENHDHHANEEDLEDFEEVEKVE